MKKISVLFFSIVLIGCSSNELDREKAKQMIESEFGFPYVETVDLKENVSKLEMNGRLKELLNDGYISTFYRNNLYQNKNMVEITDKGKTFFLEKKNGQFIMASNELRVKKVSGIKFNEDKTSAKVEYIVERYNVTPFGKDGYYNYKNGDTKKWDLDFELYDDGWRVLNKNNFKALQKSEFPNWGQINSESNKNSNEQNSNQESKLDVESKAKKDQIIFTKNNDGLIADIIVEDLRVRAAPNLDSKVLGTLSTQDRVVLTGRNTKNKTNVTINNQTVSDFWFEVTTKYYGKGWIHGCCFK